MTIIILAWKSQSITSPPSVIYSGCSGDEANKAVAGIAGEGYVRAQKLVNPIGTPVAIPSAPPKPISKKVVFRKES